MRTVFRGLLSILLVTIICLLTGVPTVQALVEPNWPAGTSNTCKYPGDFFLNFESGIDEIQIESTIPSMQFTTSGVLNWQYGDIRTGRYNVSPYHAGDYVTNGNFFAWLGTLGDWGRIDFIGGGASYCSVLVSTGSGLTLDAYDSDDNLIATSGWADNNLGSGFFTRLTVEAPADETIAYVLIHDTGNFWLIDDLCTDANKVVIPVPGRDIGNHNDRFDLIFVPDNDYGSPADIDTWLPDFIQDIQDQIDQRLDAADPVTGNLDRFNFYYTKMQGDAAANPHVLPAGLTRVVPFADAYAILHTTTFGDWTQWGPPVTFGAEGAVGRSFIHEAGHGIFRLADEYDDAPGCRTARFEPNPMPNVWDTEAECRVDVTTEDWGNPDDCWQFTTCTSGWWKFGTTRFIMEDGNHFLNGWGQPAARRIECFLDQYPCVAAGEAGEFSPEADKSIWLNMQVSAGAFSLLEKSYVVDSPPDYFSGNYAFMVKVFSNGNALLKEFGMHDPRIPQGESDYEGPTWIDSMNFHLVVPYFKSSGRVDLIESATGNIVLSADISQYATVMAPVAICKDIVVALDGNGQATISAADVDGGSYDPEGGAIQLRIDKSDFTCANLGENSVTLTVIDDEEAPAACNATVNIVDTTPPLITCPADTTIECDQPTDPSNTGTATATDNCDADPTVTHSYDIVSDEACPGDNYVITRTWTAGDNWGNVNTCEQVITVQDTTAPLITCNAPATIIPPDAPVTFTATATDNCDESPTVEITGHDCFKFTKKGKRIDKTESCVVVFSSDTVTINDSGGVDNTITWNVRATDCTGNESTAMCSVHVVNPAK